LTEKEIVKSSSISDLDKMNLAEIRLREALAVILLFLFFLAVLAATVGLAYYLKHFASPATRQFFGVKILSFLAAS